MNEVNIEHNPSETRLMELEVPRWPIWDKDISVFPWQYESSETCYFIEGEVIVTPDGGEPVKMGKGDLVTFPEGMSCVWDIKQPVKKHYAFE